MISRQALRILVLSALFALFAGACSGGGETAAQPEADDSAAAAPVASDGDAQDDRTVAAVEGDGSASNDGAAEAGSSGDATSDDASGNEGDSAQVRATAGTVGTDRDAPSSSSGATSEVVRAVSAAARTVQSEAYEFSMEFGMTGIPELPGGMTFSADGAVDPANERMWMRMDLSSLFDAAPAGTSDAELQLMRALLGDGAIEFITDGDTVYMSWSLFSALFGADTKWISFTDPAASDELLSGFGGVNVNQFGSGPEGFLSFFWGVDSIAETGRFEVRGVETTRYSGVIDIAQAIALSDPAERAALEAQIEELGAYGLSTLPVEIWIDDEGYLRKFTMTFDFSELGTVPGGPAEMYISLELFGFGEAVSIALPPPHEVTEIDDGMLFGGS